MGLQLSGKTAIVTGASVGIGRGIARGLANIVVFLASPVARYVTGAVLPVDGGLQRYAY